MVPIFMTIDCQHLNLKENRSRCLVGLALIRRMKRHTSQDISFCLLNPRSSPIRKYKGTIIDDLLCLFIHLWKVLVPNLTFTDTISLFYFVSNNKENELFTSYMCLLGFVL